MCNFPSKKPCASVVCRERIHVDKQTCCCAATASPRAAVVAASRVRAHLDPYCCEGLSFLFARRQGGLEEPRSREAKQTRKTTISKRGNWRSYPFRTRFTLYLGEEAAAQACASAADSSSRASSAASMLFAAETWALKSAASREARSDPGGGGSRNQTIFAYFPGNRTTCTSKKITMSTNRSRM